MKVGIIGTGFGASFHLPLFNDNPDFEVVSIAGRNYEKTKAIASKNNVAAFESWKELITSDVDVISVVTPPSLHYEMAKEALEQGKHIMLEKPTTSTATQADELVQLAETNMLQGMICHEWRFYSFNQLIHQLIQNDKILGKIEVVRIQDYLSYARKSTPYGWEYDQALDGGWIGIAGSHIVDLLRFITQSEVSELTAATKIRYRSRLDEHQQPRNVTAEDEFGVVGKLSNDASFGIDHVATYNQPPPSRMVISGVKGTIYTEGSNILIPERLWFAEEDEKEFVEIKLPASYTYEGEGIGDKMKVIFFHLIAEFAAAITTQNTRSPSLWDGLKNQIVLDAIRESSVNGKKVNL